MADERKIVRRVIDRYAFDTFAMSNLRPSDTGIEGAIVWVSEGEFGGADAQHGPRIKVFPGLKATSEARRNSVSVRITSPPEFLGELPSKIEKQVVRFINQNRDVLLRYWNGELSTKEMLDSIQRVFE